MAKNEQKIFYSPTFNYKVTHSTRAKKKTLVSFKKAYLILEDALYWKVEKFNCLEKIMKNQKHSMLLFFYSALIDESRTGVLRFKTDLNWDFLENNKITLTQQCFYILELRNAAAIFENPNYNIMKKIINEIPINQKHI